MSLETERARLRSELAESRRQLTGDLTDLGHAVNVRERIQDAVRRHPALWVGGGLVGGLILANLFRLPSRGSSSKASEASETVKRSLFLGLLGIAGKQILRLSEPALKRYAQQEIERWMGVRQPDSVARSSSPRPPEP